MEILYAVAVLGALGAVFGLALALASKVFHVKVDEREGRILEALPGANCGACGFPACAGCAAAILKGEAGVNACVPGGGDTAKKVAEIMGQKADPASRTVAFVRCSGTVMANKYDYSGMRDCVAATRVGNTGGPKACSCGCIGFGNCVRVCRFGAIRVVDGLARVDREKCTGCLMCVSACPKHIISPVPYDSRVFVACANTDKGAVTRKFCGNGCIACGICVKNCPSGAIRLKDNVAVIDYETCTNCGLCVEKCPRHIIHLLA